MEFLFGREKATFSVLRYTVSFFPTILGFVMSGSYLPGNGRHHHHVQGEVLNLNPPKQVITPIVTGLDIKLSKQT
jgi:hypothetical protein